ncbi:hypothetical protein GCK32_021015, partial [Trichostrongylus colubriformis]
MSPTPHSRDSSIIILDDDSPPRPPPAPAPIRTCNSAITSLSSSTTSNAFAAPPTSTMTISNGDGVMASRVPAIQTHNVLAGHVSSFVSFLT